jgi:hypothetical protein
MSDCGICLGIDDYEPPSFCLIEIRLAKKTHICCECKQEIKSRQKYEYTSGRWDERFETYKTCMICKDIRESFCCNGWEYTTLWSDIYENLFPIMTTGCLNKLSTVEAKKLLLEKWNEWKFKR